MGLSNLLKSPKTGSDGEFVRPVLSAPHKWFILFLFCFAEFMDAFIASALFPGINDMIRDLKLVPTDATWIFAAYSATFAGFLLISGRVADIYSASQYHLSLQLRNRLDISRYS
jgi:MFS family permease